MPRIGECQWRYSTLSLMHYAFLCSFDMWHISGKPISGQSSLLAYTGLVINSQHPDQLLVS